MLESKVIKVIIIKGALVTVLEAAAAAVRRAESHGAHGIRHVPWKRDKSMWHSIYGQLHVT